MSPRRRRSREIITRTPASTRELPPEQPGVLRQKGGLSHGRIARRAYDLRLERGRQEGHDVEDWLRAEADQSRPPG